MKITVKHSQSVFDVSIQEYGTVEAALEIAFANDVSLTEELIAGDELELPEFENTNPEIMAYYNKHQIKPATALSDADFAIVELESCNLCDCFK